MDWQPVDEQPVDKQAVEVQPVDEQPVDKQPVDKWPMVRLEDVCELERCERGASYPSGRSFCESGIPFIAAENLVDGRISYIGMKYITAKKYDELRSGKISDGDWLYSLRGNIGVQTIASGLGKAAVASSVLIVRPRNILEAYLRHYMNSCGFRGQQMKVDNGILKPNLAASDVKNFLIPLPPLRVQQEIADVLDRVCVLISKRKEQIEELDAQGVEAESETDEHKKRLQSSLGRLELLYESRMSKYFEGEMLAPPTGYTGAPR